MNRGNVAWLLSLPLSAAGMLLAHEFAWELAGHSHEAGQAHSYLQYGAIVAALLAATLIVAATAELIRGVSGAGVGGAPSAWVFATVPLLGFMVQEHLEHLVVAQELQISFFLSPPFLLGLALQLPFALGALLVARAILGLVATVARVVKAMLVVPGLTSLELRIPAVIALTPRPALATRSAGRAPPHRS